MNCCEFYKWQILNLCACQYVLSNRPMYYDFGFGFGFEFMTCSGFEVAAMWQFALLAMIALSSGEKCFQCGDDKHPACTHRMSVSLSDLSVDTVCVHLGSCVKFNGTALLLPGLHFFSVTLY